MAKRCGVSPDPARRSGSDWIDPDRTIEALDDYADRLALAAVRRESVLLATGHPIGLLGFYATLGRVLGEHGCPILTPRPSGSDQVLDGTGEHIEFVEGVAVLADRTGALRHTHAPAPMNALLAGLTDRGEAPPGLVLADHGWAGAAGQAGIDTLGLADSNDPGLFVGEAEGRVQVVVPLDDNVHPPYYGPLITYLVRRADLGESADL